MGGEGGEGEEGGERGEGGGGGEGWDGGFTWSVLSCEAKSGARRGSLRFGFSLVSLVNLVRLVI